ncbi:MAG: dipeptidase, partial [Anaerolineaceae bacterium]|nr:dipeptidase [Anaerolineaceae bacterium]
MNNVLTKALSYSANHKEEYLNELISFVKIPSVSTDPIHKPDMLKAAEWLVANLNAAGIENTKILPTKGHPVVYGDWMKAGKDKPIVLIYGHYDVQPAEPLDLWTSTPFDPEIRNGNLFGRGSSDMKGQILTSIKSVEAILKFGALPVNIKFLLEGEEEIGSPNLPAFMSEHKELLKADFALNPDTGMISPTDPTIVYGLRGLAYFELRVYGPSHDLHSGVFGGVVHNPAVVLAELIAGMHDSLGKITLPGFYDDVIPLSAKEREELGRLPTNEEFYLTQTGSPVIHGESGFTPTELIGGRPTLDVNGLYSGFTGEGSKTVIPAWAMAKISTRLVPDQKPEKIKKSLLEYLEKKAPKSIRWELITMAGGPAYMANLEMPGIKALCDALETVWQKKPVYKREGGSVPVVSEMKAILGVDSVLTGFGLPDDNIHAPNEKLHLQTWYRGIDALIHFFINL